MIFYVSWADPYYDARKLDPLTYQVKIPYETEEELYKNVYDIINDIAVKADDHNCQVDMNAWGRGNWSYMVAVRPF